MCSNICFTIIFVVLPFTEEKGCLTRADQLCARSPADLEKTVCVVWHLPFFFMQKANIFHRSQHVRPCSGYGEFSLAKGNAATFAAVKSKLFSRFKNEKFVARGCKFRTESAAEWAVCIHELTLTHRLSVALRVYSSTAAIMQRTRYFRCKFRSLSLSLSGPPARSYQNE